MQMNSKHKMLTFPRNLGMQIKIACYYFLIYQIGEICNIW